MRSTTESNLLDIVRILRQYKFRWLAPLGALTALTLVYAIVRPATWEASQALIVRDESNSKPDRPGRFVNPEDMKTIQETILELAKSRSVLTAALVQVGPEKGPAADNFPTDKDIAALQGQVKITPPRGLEFGKTEVFYLKVQASTPARAVAVANAVCGHLQAHFAELRNDKAISLVNELTKTVDLAQQDLNTATHKLSNLEVEVGSDLAELRMLNDSPAGDSDLRHRTTEMENELRQARVAQQTEHELLSLLVGTQDDPKKLLATPGKLLEAQPALRHLKDGLVEAQLRTAQLAGTVSPSHPLYLAAKINEEEVQQQLRNEIGTAIQGLEVEHRMTVDRVEALDRMLGEARGRMKKLASIRADYGNLVADVRQRTEIVKTAQQSLSEARANQAGSQVASTITKVDSPDVGTGPVGPSRSQTVVLGACSGLILGLGIVFLTTPGGPIPDAAENDFSAERTAHAEVPSATCGELAPTAREAFMQGAPFNLKNALKKIGSGR
ncbi:MAG TPA: hypothetical protein VFE24_09155 [Pirellulales bacterium]|nr:hypothetical protein [Pirellulales bacterium]